MSATRDFTFTDQDFRCIRKLVNEHTGIALSDAKQDMVYSRLSRRVRALKLDDFNSYCQLIEKGDDEAELIEFVNSITTNLTSFFRESHHFDYLGTTLFPNLLRTNQSNKRIRIWSAGCSTGEEPYSLAILVRENIPDDWDVKILATDLDSNVVEKAKTGVYEEERVNGIDSGRLRKWFKKGTGQTDGKVKVSSLLQSIITFKQLNLMREWPMSGPFDLIFCRNVVIYFDKATQKVLFNRFADILDHQGYLFVGHSESLYRVTDRFKLLNKTIYQRIR